MPKCRISSLFLSSLGLGLLVGLLAAGHVDRHVALGRVGVEDEALGAAGLVWRHAVEADVVEAAGGQFNRNFSAWLLA